MKMTELHGKTSDQLKELVGNLKKEQFNLRVQVATGELKNVARFKEVRRAIARALTLLNQKKD